MVRSATGGDFEEVSRLYAQLNVDDPPVAGPQQVRVFQQILDRDGLDILLLELGGEVVGTSLDRLGEVLGSIRTDTPGQDGR